MNDSSTPRAGTTLAASYRDQRALMVLAILLIAVGAMVMANEDSASTSDGIACAEGTMFGDNMSDYDLQQAAAACARVNR